MVKWNHVPLWALVAVALLSGIHGAQAQIPNGDFESWSNNAPVAWLTTNAPGDTFISQSTAAHSGSFAARGSVVVIFSNDIVLAPLLVSGTETGGFPISSRPEALRGFYTLNSVGGDFLFVVVSLQKEGNYIGTGAVMQPAAGDYTEFVANIFYASPDVPDTALIEVVISNAGGNVHPGSEFTIDDLVWGAATTDVQQSTTSLPTEFRLEQNYPNPFNPVTMVRYDVPAAAVVKLAVYDLLGREVAVLVNENKAPGRYEVAFDASRLSSGIYLYSLQSGKITQTRRMILLK